MSRQDLIIASLFLGFTATGCLHDAGEPLDGENQEEVVNGFYDFTKQAVVIQTTRGDQRANCTGTLIDDVTVITAAHCLDGNVTGVVVGTGLFGADLEQVIAARTWAYDTRFNRNTPGLDMHKFDVGVIKLTRGAGVGALPFDMAPVQAAKGTRVKMIGYGSGDRLAANIPVGAVTGGLIFAEEGLLAQGSEGGDSGGPMLLNGTLRAVTSGGGERADGSQVTIFTELAPSADFINRARNL